MMLRLHPRSFTIPDKMTGGRLCYIFSGPIPVVDKNFTFNLATYDAQRLGSTTVPFVQNVVNASIAMSSSYVPSFIATGTGTATWFAMSSNTNTSGTTEYMIGSVTSDPTANDPMLLNMVDLQAGVQASVVDFKVTFGV